MSLIFDKQHERLDTYIYQINGGGKYNIKEVGFVKIMFKNGKFESCTFPFHGVWGRNGWRIIASIEAEISQLEEELELETP